MGKEERPALWKAELSTKNLFSPLWQSDRQSLSGGRGREGGDKVRYTPGMRLVGHSVLVSIDHLGQFCDL